MSCLIMFFVPANIGEEHVTHTKATLMNFHWYFLFFLDRSAKVRLPGQEILELHDFVLSLPSPATHLESSVCVSHCMIVSYCGSYVPSFVIHILLYVMCV